MLIQKLKMLENKPEEGFSCNGCGFCCTSEVCKIGLSIFPEAEAPCPALILNEEGIYRCGVVIAEKENKMEPLIHDALGIGKGCCSTIFTT